MSAEELQKIVSEIETERALFQNGYAILSQLTRPLGSGTIGKLAEKLGTDRNNIGRIARVAELLAAHPELKEKYEPKILSGELRILEAHRLVRSDAASLESAPRVDFKVDELAADVGRLKTALQKTAPGVTIPKGKAAPEK